MLYIIPTPIGNLADWTYRARSTAESCDYLLCEDTRRSDILLKHYQIQKPLVSYHKFNEQEREASILNDLHAGKIIGLLSDGGTPLIQDPGARLIRRCSEERLSVSALPGPCSIITALAFTGLGDPPFQFLGFMPKKQGEKRDILLDALLYKGSSIFFDTPHELLDSLKMISDLSPAARVSVARELSKTFEEKVEGRADAVLAHFEAKPPKGEIVLIIQGDGPPKIEGKEALIELTAALQRDFKLSQKEAIELAAKISDFPKKVVYNLFHKKEKGDLN